MLLFLNRNDFVRNFLVYRDLYKVEPYEKYNLPEGVRAFFGFFIVTEL